jgi:hypothetical protein
MACFVVPGTEAIVVTAAALLLKRYEQKKVQVRLTSGTESAKEPAKSGFARKLFWLADLLWGGVLLLAFEHLWHGEVIPTFPFLTAVKTGEVSEMLGEMATAGVMMAMLVTLVWAGIVAVVTVMEKKADKEPEIAEENA